jgi:hypothetical protein
MACHVLPPSCSYPTLNEQAIPNELAALYNWICMIVAVFVIELLLFRKQHSLTVGITGETAADCCGSTYRMHIVLKLMLMRLSCTDSTSFCVAIISVHVCDRGFGGKHAEQLRTGASMLACPSRLSSHTRYCCGSRNTMPCVVVQVPFTSCGAA